MSTVELHSVPKDTLLNSSGTYLTVSDENGSLVADYSLCTGLRLIQDGDRWIIYVNDADLVPGSWTLFVDALDESVPSETIHGVKEGAPASRVLADFPWSACGPVPRVSKSERSGRLAVCLECPLFEPETMTCGESGKFVLDVTTRSDEFCPQDLWGDREAVTTQRVEQAIANGTVIENTTITPEEQQAFEAELDAFLEESP